MTGNVYPYGTSTGEEFLAAMDTLKDFYNPERQWNWWREGQANTEHDRLMAIIKEWDHAAPPPGGYLTAEEYKAQMDERAAQREQERQARAAAFDQERSAMRISMLSENATVAFMDIILNDPASEAQRAKTEELRTKSAAKALKLKNQIGDPETVVDERGDLPATRRGYNLSSHMDFFRHRLLRELSASKQRARFNQLLAMPAPLPEDMCSECQAPTEWHHYGMSLCLWRGKPAPGSRAEQLERFFPGWLERCSACTHYQLRHQWGGDIALPDFNGDQWQAMLTPLLRSLFAPQKAPARKKPVDHRKALERRLASAEAEVERLRHQLSEADPDQTA